MKNYLLPILLLFVGFNNYSQQTKRYKELTKNLKFIDSVKTIKKFKNGKVKKVFTECTYEFGDYEYTYYCSDNLIYKRNGNLVVKEKIDGFGSMLSYDVLDKKGRVYMSIRTTEIDNISTNTKEFLTKEKNFKIKVIQKNYYACDNDSLILYQEGKKMNGKKFGVWKTYNCCGSIFKEKNHSK